MATFLSEGFLKPRKPYAEAWGGARCFRVCSRPMHEECRMESAEKICVKWNDFGQNVRSLFSQLRKDGEFADVTLACEDGQQVEANKVVLAASSPFFQNLLKRSRHPHPLIYMRGVKYEDLIAIVDFFYIGEADVFQENLNSFLAIAQELKLKGLIGQMEDVQKKTETFYKTEKSKLNADQMQLNLEPKIDKLNLEPKLTNQI